MHYFSYMRTYGEHALNLFLDGLMFIVPLLELVGGMNVIPPDWLPWYIVGMVILRRLVRILQKWLHREPIVKPVIEK